MTKIVLITPSAFYVGQSTPEVPFGFYGPRAEDGGIDISIPVHSGPKPLRSARLTHKARRHPFIYLALQILYAARHILFGNAPRSTHKPQPFHADRLILCQSITPINRQKDPF